MRFECFDPRPLGLERVLRVSVRMFEYNELITPCGKVGVSCAHDIMCRIK